MKRIEKVSEAYRERIVEWVQSRKEPVTESEIAAELGVRGSARKQLRLLLGTLVLEGEIVRIRDTHYSAGDPADLVTGHIEILRSSDAVVQPLDGSFEVFIPRGNLHTAFPRDRVVVRLDPTAKVPVPGQRRLGKVIRILERSKRAVTGTLKSTKNFLYVVPIDPSYAQDFYVPDAKGARVDDRVVIQFTAWENKHVSPEAEIIEVIGPQDNPSLDTLAMMRHYNLPESFPDEVIRDAEAGPAWMDQPGEREDLRRRYILTIDPETARDFDDAISLETDSRGRRVLGVHIADVSHFVRPGTALDREARQRGNSVYLPDRVIPMLPEQLSNGLCSLRPNEDRLTFSVFITVDETGTPVQSRFCKSIIRSCLRLNYGQALKVLEGKGNELSTPVPAEAVRLLQATHALAQQMRGRRFSQHALDLDMPEYEVIMGSESMIVDIRRNDNDISHQLIEECMVAANEAVDRELCARGYELIHRVHEAPTPEKIEMLAAQLVDLGFRPGDLGKRPNMTAFLKTLKGHLLEYDAKVFTLKSMKRALYSAQALGHYGLAKKYYAHFTSPIRRYPDLIVHRILAESLGRKRNPYGHSDLEGLSRHCSNTEQVAEQAEKALLEIKKYRFLEQQLKTQKPIIYDAVVVRVKNFGLFVELTQLRIQGLVHVSGISKEFVRYNSERETLQAGRSVFAVGTKVKVKAARVDFDKRQLDFALTEMPAPSAAVFKGKTAPSRQFKPGRPRPQEKPQHRKPSQRQSCRRR